MGQIQRASVMRAPRIMQPMGACPCPSSMTGTTSIASSAAWLRHWRQVCARPSAQLPRRLWRGSPATIRIVFEQLRPARRVYRLEQVNEALIPLRRMGTVDDIGQTAVFLASPLASYVSGCVVVVDGGQNLIGSAFFNAEVEEMLRAQSKSRS